MLSTRILWAASRTPIRARGTAMPAVEAFSTVLGVASPAYYAKTQHSDARNGGMGALHAWSPPV
jgi:hypothetical protein